MLAANPVGTPLDLNIQLEPNTDGTNGNRSDSSAHLLGKWQWVANTTRPDIAYAVNKLATYTANPPLQHVTTLKQILWYLAGTKNFGITYQINPNNNNSINDSSNLFYGYANAAYANANKLKSTSGYVFLASGGAITWKSEKQAIRALSSTEAEYIAISKAGHEIWWIQTLFQEIGYP